MLHSKTLFSEVKARFDLSILLSMEARKPLSPRFGRLTALAEFCSRARRRLLGRPPNCGNPSSLVVNE